MVIPLRGVCGAFPERLRGALIRMLALTSAPGKGVLQDEGLRYRPGNRGGRSVPGAIACHGCYRAQAHQGMGGGIRALGSGKTTARAPGSSGPTALRMTRRGSVARTRGVTAEYEGPRFRCP